MKIEKLSGTLQKLLAARGLAGRLGIYRIIGQWEGAVGDVIARHAQPLSLRGRKLTVQVDSPVWMQQLSLLKPELIGKVNKGLGEDAIKDIMLALGEVRGRPKRKDAAQPLPPLSEEDRKLIERTTGTIREPEIRAAISKVMEKDMRSRKGKRSKRTEDRGQGSRA